MSENSPEIRPYHKYLFRDYVFSVACLFGPGVWVLVLLKEAFGITFRGVFRSATTQETIIGAIVVTVVALMFGTWRWLRLRSLFGLGVFVDAEVIDSTSTRLHLRYRLKESGYEKIISPPNRALLVGQSIRIVVDPNNPKRIALAQ